MRIGGRKALIGGFHDHWYRNGSHNASLLMAAMNYYHYDFICLMDSSPIDDWLRQCLESYCPWMRMYLGHEKCYGWGHVITVEHRGVAPDADDPDYAAVLRTLTEQSAFCALAHPSFPVTREKILQTGDIHRLLDDGIVDAIQSEWSPEEREWLRQRNRAGKRTPLVSGWDHHLFKPTQGLPRALYDAQFPPDVNLDTVGSRTIVLAEENSLAAIVKAVKAGDVAVEHLASHELAGTQATVDFLLENGYRDKIAELDARRDATKLDVDHPPVAGQRLLLRFSERGSVLHPGSLDHPVETRTRPDGTLVIDSLPPLQDRDRCHFPVVQTLPCGYSRVWGVELNHPITLDVLPKIEHGKHLVEFATGQPLQAEVEFRPEPFSAKLGITPEASCLDVTEHLHAPILTYSMTARNESGISRRFSGVVTFLEAPTFDGDWSEVPVYAIDSAEFCGGYGANRPYPGAGEFSARVQFAWNRDAFLLRADVTDPIHHQPFSGHMLYQGDALQLAIDPMMRRRETLGSTYIFNLALTANGPELFRLSAPGEEVSESFSPPEPNRTLGARYLDIEPKAGGLTYLMSLPWRELAPITPRTGHRLGLYLILKNNNGDGLIDSLRWPWEFGGMWMIPRKWGVLNLT